MSEQPRLNGEVWIEGEPLEAEPFEGPRLKAQHARQHLATYRAAFATLSADYLQGSTTVNPDRSGAVFKLKMTKALPASLRLSAADVLYNLRSALDQAANACSRIALGRECRETYFPHGVDLAGFHESLHKRCGNMPDPAQQVIKDLEPYYGGKGALLRVLHDLNIADKHRDLIGVGAAVLKMELTENAPNHPSKNTHTMNVRLAVTFTDVEAIEGKSVTAVLQQLCTLVDETISKLEDAMRDFHFHAAAIERHS